MDKSDIFFRAVCSKLRFDGGRGGYTAEDLMELDLQALNRMAVAIHEKVAPEKVTSFLSAPDTKATREQTENKLRLDILVFIIKHKEANVAAAKSAAATTAQLHLLEDLLQKKKLGKLAEASEEELLAQIQALRGETPAAASPEPAGAPA